MTKSGPQNNYVTPAVELICDLHLRLTVASLMVLSPPSKLMHHISSKPMHHMAREGPGDILLFLTGQDEIDKACLQIQKFTKVTWMVFSVLCCCCSYIDCFYPNVRMKITLEMHRSSLCFRCMAPCPVMCRIGFLARLHQEHGEQ
jgi:hypothetical protein